VQEENQAAVWTTGRKKWSVLTGLSQLIQHLTELNGHRLITFGEFAQGFGADWFDAGDIEWHRVSFAGLWVPVININEVSASESFPWPKPSNGTHNVHGTGVVGILTDDYFGSGFHIVSSSLINKEFSSDSPAT
jgi:hypothetical protein